MIDKPYSDWHKIDLHIHTDKSKETKSGDYSGVFSVDVLHNKLVENEVGIFSLTDHNIINVGAYEEYYSKYNSETDPLLLVGVELDIEIHKTGGSIKNYHTLLVFNCSDIDGMKRLSTLLENEYSEKNLNKINRKLTMEQVSRIFFGEDFFFIPHAGSSQSIVDAYKPGNVRDASRMVILMQSAVEKVSKEETRNIYIQGFDRERPEDHRGQRDIAFINFSDNHNIQQYPCLHKGGRGNHDFHYVKGSKSYETIRLAFIDPESRIITGDKFRKLKYNGTNLERFRIRNSDFIQLNDIHFSPYLNVIIGGRSSGKSLLLWMLGKSIDSIQEGNDYDLKYTDTVIKTIDDKELREKVSINRKDIIYIKQGEIVEYFDSKDLKDLATKVGKLEEYDSAYDEFKSHNSELHTLQNNLTSSYKKVFDENKDKTFILQAKTISDMQSEEVILKIDARKLITEVDNDDEITELKEVISRLKEDINSLKTNKLISITKDEIDIIDAFESVLKDKELQVTKISELLDAKINFINDSDDLINETVVALDKKASDKAESNKKYNSWLNDIGDCFKHYKQLKVNCDNLETFNHALEREITLHENVKLILEVDNSDSIKEVILGCLLKNYPGETIYKNILYLLKADTTVKNHKDNQPSSFAKKIEAELKDIKALMLSPNDFLKYSEEDISKNKSPGYNSEQYLKLILQQTNTKSVFIDQPEDNLGNKFISKDLVEILRSIKHQKQIFLVTHNPSIVVYGDAECVIISENKTKEISYKQVKLEDKDAQREICDILDGGEYIFNKRSEKYDIKKLLSN